MRNCVIDVMDAGLNKQDVLDVAKEIGFGNLKDEMYLCIVTAIGQALGYKPELIKLKILRLISH